MSETPKPDPAKATVSAMFFVGTREPDSSPPPVPSPATTPAPSHCAKCGQKLGKRSYGTSDGDRAEYVTACLNGACPNWHIPVVAPSAPPVPAPGELEAADEPLEQWAARWSAMAVDVAYEHQEEQPELAALIARLSSATDRLLDTLERERAAQVEPEGVKYRVVQDLAGRWWLWRAMPIEGGWEWDMVRKIHEVVSRPPSGADDAR